eukprot:XP_001692952.1 guanylate cyclase [Chlamydomonas reinhardtii]
MTQLYDMLTPVNTGCDGQLCPESLQRALSELQQEKNRLAEAAKVEQQRLHEELAAARAAKQELEGRVNELAKQLAAAGSAEDDVYDTCRLPVAPLDLSRREWRPGGGKGAWEGPRGLRSVTVDSVRRGAEAEGLRVTLSVLDRVGETDPRATYGAWYRRMSYVSPMYCQHIDAPDEAAAIRTMNVTLANNVVVRSAYTGYLKLLLVGGEPSPAVMRPLVYHSDRRSELVMLWMFPVLVYGTVSELGGEDVAPGDDRMCRRIGLLAFTDPATSAARQFEGMMRDHMGLKYTPSPITMVDEDGVIVTQNPSSACSIGTHGYEARLAGSTRFNYLTQLFASEPGLEADMRRVTAAGGTWSRRLRISDSPILRKWMELEEDEERWHEVQISKLRDPLHLTSSFIIAETDVTATVLAQHEVLRLQRHQQALLKQILPQQVIDVMLSEDRDDDGSGGEQGPRRVAKSMSRRRLGSGVLSRSPIGLGRSARRGRSLGADNVSPRVVAAASAAPPHACPPQTCEPRTMMILMPDGTTHTLDLMDETDGSDSAIQLSRSDVMSLATWHEDVTILFADIKGFTTMSQQLHPARVMLFLDTLYNAFDLLLDECGCYKVETIGDCYMVAGGLFATPDPDGSGEMQLGGYDPDHALKVLRFAIQMADIASRLRTPFGEPVQMRIGIHSGACMSGVVGRRMPRFCLFGDTINTASRMESTGAPGAIHVSEATQRLLPTIKWQPRGEGIEVKGKGLMQTYWWGGDTTNVCFKARDRVIDSVQMVWVLDASSNPTIFINPVHSVYGYMHMDSWDLLWSVTAKAALAADLLRHHQMLAIVPGLLAVSRKTTLVRSLRDMFGDAAWGIVPRSYKLPDELDEWGQWVADNPGADTGMWMLKNNKQRGTGLRLVRTSEAFTACFETVSRPDLPPGMRLYRWYLAQQYITRPMLIDGRKFGVRVWVLVSDVAPLRLYIHGRGLVLFSSHRYDSELVAGADGSGPAPGHVTNYAQNENGDVWSLEQLAGHVGARAFSKLWADMCRGAAMAFAAALPRCAEVMEGVRPPAHSCFQFFGLDFLVDAAARPWLLEVNATPSMKVEHEDAGVAALIGAQKWPAVRDMVALVGISPQRFEEGAAGSRGAPDRSTPAYALEELRRRGGFVPLLHLLPHPAASTTPEAAAAAGLLRPLPWSRADRTHGIRGLQSM